MLPARWVTRTAAEGLIQLADLERRHCAEVGHKITLISNDCLGAVSFGHYAGRVSVLQGFVLSGRSTNETACQLIP